MKKLRLLAFAVIALLAVAMSTNVAARTYTDAEVKTAIKLIDDGCPADMGDGMVLTSATIKEGKIVFRVLVDEEDLIIEVMGVMSDELEKSLLPELKNDENLQPVIEYCKANKCNFVMTMYNQNGKSADIVFHYQSM